MGNSNGKPVVLTDEVNLNHFRLLRVVGKGAFGKVRIVERKDSGLTFALKYIRKDEVVRSESVRNIIRERRMLEHLNHPFVCNLRYSFQDIEYLYIVVDLMTGGDLRFHITRKAFTEEAVRFWIAELGCALRYVHGQGIVHRDVKPDNVLLDVEGHVHLADFNVASEFTPHRQLTSKSGTMAYLAPEVYMGKGYQSEVDWWGLGVLFYECIYNRRPFEAHHHDQLAQSIVRASPAFPVTKPPVSNPCLHAISSLLEKDKTKRIGAAGFHTFTDNPFFREIDFAALERKEVEPVFCPSSDKTNFDATYDLEELLLEEAPLEARARKQKPRAELRGDATQQEIRADELHKMIETMFEPFNYTLLPTDREPAAPDSAEASNNNTTTSSTSKKSASKTSPTQTGASDPSSSQHRTRPKDASKQPQQPEKQPKDQSQQQQQQQQDPRPVPSRSQTPHNLTKTRSSQHSPNGSPPINASALPPEYFNSNENGKAGPSSPKTPTSPPTDQAKPQNPRARVLRYEETNNESGPASPTSNSTQPPNAAPSSSTAAAAAAANAIANTNKPTPLTPTSPSTPKSPKSPRASTKESKESKDSKSSVSKSANFASVVGIGGGSSSKKAKRSSSIGGGGAAGLNLLKSAPARAGAGAGVGGGAAAAGGGCDGANGGNGANGAAEGPGGSSAVVIVGGSAAGKGSGANGNGTEKSEKPSGMLGFLSRKKGRDRSPKGKERGVLGKEGARAIVSH